MLLFGFKEAGVFLSARLHAIQLVKAIFSTGPSRKVSRFMSLPPRGTTGGPVALPQPRL